MEKHQFTNDELLTVVRRGLFAIDDLYDGNANAVTWFNLVKRFVNKYITREDDPLLYMLLGDIEENIDINPSAAIRSLNKLLMFLSAIEAID